MSRIERTVKAEHGIEEVENLVEVDLEQASSNGNNTRFSWPTEASDDTKKSENLRLSTSAIHDIQYIKQSLSSNQQPPIYAKYRRRMSTSVEALRARRSQQFESIEMGELSCSTTEKDDSPIPGNCGNGSVFSTLREEGGSLGFRTAVSMDNVSTYKITDPSSSTILADSQMRNETKRKLTSLMSIIYAFWVISLGTIFPLLPSVDLNHIVDHSYSIINCLIGTSWLLFLQVDIALYKRRIVRRIKDKLAAIDKQAEHISTSTDAVLQVLEMHDWNNEATGRPLYRFQRGRHSGSFFLKAGMTVFCFGHLMYEGLTLAKVVMTSDFTPRVMHLLLALHVIKPIYSFYQLFMVFKYSHVIINHNPSVARFGLMHMISTSITFWLRSIILDAESSHQDSHHVNSTNSKAMLNSIVDESGSLGDEISWTSGSGSHSGPLSNFNLIYHLYPFTIEFSIIIAGVWFIMWLNIGGAHHHKASDAHLEPTLQENEVGELDLTYRSQLVISADCHSANKGIFAGLATMLGSMVSVIMFFVFVDVDNNENNVKLYQGLALAIYNIQEVTLSGVALLAVALAFRKTSSLSFNPAPITFLDDFLLVIPIPFFFVNTALNVIAETCHPNGSYYRAGIVLLQLLQVLLQTPMLIDGLRRASFSAKQRYQKPGRELVTFLIIINLAMWVVFTFEQKKMDALLAASKFFSDRWLYIGHTTVPLMLFYRFHSAVCFADIWKSAYEKEDD